MKEAEYRAMFDVEKTHWWFVARKIFLQSLLGNLPKKKRTIVDIGAGTGGMIRFLRQYGKTVVGLEPNVVGRALAKKRGIILRPGEAENTKIRAHSVDMVCFFDVLYHQGIRDTRALAEAKRILRPGGLLLITDCAVPFLAGPHDRAVEGRERYTLSRFVRTVKRAGFQVERQTYMYFLLFPVIAMKRLIDRIFASGSEQSDVMPAKGWINTIANVVNRLEAFGLRWVSYPWGSSLCIMAHKREADGT